ncbi:hypothetical protein ACET3Z_013373 [Daucus carota]
MSSLIIFDSIIEEARCSTLIFRCMLFHSSGRSFQLHDHLAAGNGVAAGSNLTPSQRRLNSVNLTDIINGLSLGETAGGCSLLLNVYSPDSWNRVLLLRLQDDQDVRSVHGFLAIQCCFRFLLVLLIDIGSLSPGMDGVSYAHIRYTSIITVAYYAAFLKRDFVGRIEPTLKFLSSSPGQMSICRENENVVGRREKG